MLMKQPPRKLCQLCNTSLVKSNGISKHGFKKWHKYCSYCAKGKYNKNLDFLVSKKTKCDKCNFIAEDRCQLSLIFLDGNKKNVEKNNIKTYCANCNKLHQKQIKSKSLFSITVDTDLLI